MTSGKSYEVSGRTPALMSPNVDSWRTASEELDADVSLAEYVALDRQVAKRVDEDDRAQVGVRSLPNGLRAVLGRLAREHAVSFSSFTRAAFEYGVVLLEQELWIQTLRDVYDSATAAAMDEGQRGALRRLDRKVQYDFRDPVQYRTTLAVSRVTKARIAELAHICGIYAGQFAVVALLRALLTLDNNRGYRKSIEEEVAAFREFILHRILELQLPDAPSRLAVTQRRHDAMT